ncbi:WXG100 family type VII secretion target [Lacrimispora sp. BS-2]|uniref:WXG100 family type VII secretion target n=1 Tax=Lacrimispora sp. BS-2 TaxID=3151850 RepID=A0AAU7PJ73_9FIRM
MAILQPRDIDALKSLFGSVTFKVTPEVLNAKANEVSSLIKKVRMEFDNLNTSINRTKTYWIGEAGDAHRKAYEDQKTNIDEIIRRLEEHPRDLVSIARTYTDAELEIEEYISSLPSDLIE